MRILYIAVNYRTVRHARRFIECLRGASQNDRLIMVDNTEPERREPLNVDPALGRTVFERPAPDNLGYFGGARFGIDTQEARDFDPDWTVVSNVDVVFNPAQVRTVMGEYDREAVGVVAPAIVGEPSHENLNPFMVNRPTPWRMRGYGYVFHTYPGYAAYSWLSQVVRHRAWRRPRTAGRGEGAIYAPHGAFMILSREFFRRGGSLDHPPFLYGEEITVAERARAVSLSVRYCPRIRVVHHQHASISALPSRVNHRLAAAASVYVANAYFR